MSMKKIISMILALCLCAAPLMGFADAYVTVEELREQASERWHQSYETKWRTVEIDVQPQVPDVDAVPILMVAPDWSFPEALTQNQEWEGRHRDVDHSSQASPKAWGGKEPEEYKRVREMKNRTQNEKWYYPPFDLERMYVEDSGVTLGGLLDEARALMLQLGIDPEDWTVERPKEMGTVAYHTKQGEYLTCLYVIDMFQKLRGIPVYERFCDRVSEHPVTVEMSFFRYAPNAAQLFWITRLKILDVITEDVPLCDFSTIRSAIEEKIYSGNIRKIFDVDFGYALFNPPGVSYGDRERAYESSFTYAVPMWRVSCHYASSGGKKLRDYTGLDVPERGVMEYEELMFYAQTGEMFNSMNTRRGDGEYKGFVSWEDVGGKR